MAALEQLELERANLRSRLDKVDALIVSMRDVFHLPAPPRPHTNGTATVTRAVPVRPAVPRATNGRGSISVEAIAAALRKGPVTPGALATTLQVPRARLTYHLNQLAVQGLVQLTGTTSSRRVALAAPAAKEGL